jgi:hypothetical protein
MDKLEWTWDVPVAAARPRVTGQNNESAERPEAAKGGDHAWTDAGRSPLTRSGSRGRLGKDRGPGRKPQFHCEREPASLREAEVPFLSS